MALSLSELLTTQLRNNQPQENRINQAVNSQTDAFSERELESMNIFDEALPFPIDVNYEEENDEESQNDYYGGSFRDLSLEELLANGHRKTTYPLDGFISFHHVKYITSNAKQLSKLFQMTMGFKEIAYRGLENGSKLLASHVIQNNGVVIEFISTLESLNAKLAPLPSVIEDMDYLRFFNTKASVDRTLQDIQPIMNLLLEDLLEQHLIKLNGRAHLLNSIKSSNQFKEWNKSFSAYPVKLAEICSTQIEDTLDSQFYGNYLSKHGEGIVDTTFLVDDVETIFEQAVSNGAAVLKYPKIISDANGSVKLATILVPNTDIRHTLIQNIDFVGEFLPGYMKPMEPEVCHTTSAVLFSMFDHCVENYTWDQMLPQARFYAKIFKFHKFWSVDEEDVSTENSSLKSTVMTSSNECIKIPINEPSKGKMKSQIEEFYESNDGPGFQHIALRTNNIIETVTEMKLNGIEFNTIGEDYYNTLFKRLKDDDVCLREDLPTLKSLNILVDYDVSTRNKKTKVSNYLLQIFTKPLNDRPTLFLEIIQRHHHNGFGKGTFKGLFETIEKQQKLRGNLVPSDH